MSLDLNDSLEYIEYELRMNANGSPLPRALALLELVATSDPEASVLVGQFERAIDAFRLDSKIAADTREVDVRRLLHSDGLLIVPGPNELFRMFLAEYVETADCPSLAPGGLQDVVQVRVHFVGGTLPLLAPCALVICHDANPVFVVRGRV